MRTLIALTLAVVLFGVASRAGAQAVVTYYPSSVPVTTYYAPSTTAYYAPSTTTTYYAPTTTYYAPSTTTTYYAPSVPVTTYYAPTTTYWVSPKVYVAGQPVRNVLRAITP